MMIRSVVSGLALTIAVGVAMAQEAPKGGAAKAEPNAVKTTRISPSGKQIEAKQAAPKQGAADAGATQASPERLSLQSDLAWTGFYNGLINGEASDRLIAATKAWQKDHGAKETTALNPVERATLATEAKTVQVRVGWKVLTDIGSGMRLGIPEKLLPNTRIDASGTRWSAPSDTVSITLTKRREAGLTLAA